MQSKINKLTNSKTDEIYRTIIDHMDYKSPHQFIESSYKKYQMSYDGDQNTNGRIFEYLICETLAQQGITPFYYQATFERVPNVVFDIVLYDPIRPVLFTTKTSLRERYKQADLEGVALRHVYRQAETYLITMSVDEADSVTNKINDGTVLGITQCVIASNPQYKSLLTKMTQRNFSQAKPITPVAGKHLIK